MKYSNEEEPLTGFVELAWRASRLTMARLGQVAFGLIDKLDTEAADRINNVEDELWIERGEN